MVIKRGVEGVIFVVVHVSFFIKEQLLVTGFEEFA